MNTQARVVLLLLGFSLVLGLSYMIFWFVGAFALGLFIYYCTRPVYRFLVSRDVNSSISSIVAQLSFIIPVILLVGYAVQIVAFELSSFTGDAKDTILNLLDGQESLQELVTSQEFLDSLPVNTENLRENGTSQEIGSVSDLSDVIDTGLLVDLVDVSFNLSSLVVSSISGLFFTLLIAFSFSFYLQRDGEKIKRLFLESVEYDRDIIRFLEDLDSDLRVVFLGNIALALGTAILGATTFYIISIIAPGGSILIYPGVIGFLCGAASLIPVIGMKLVYYPVTIGLYSVSIATKPIPEALIFPTIFFVVATVVVDGIPDLIARPYIGSWSGVSTSILLFSYILGPLALGWYGLFLGPIIFVVSYEFVDDLLPELIQYYR